MANKKKIAAKSKTKTSKYSKLMKAASKELADKKKALVKAEKALATATRNHQELLQETARLDMLERSLKALVEGTEPPQNVRYVYSYPQWVWYGNPNGWYWYGNGYTTLQSQTGLSTITTTAGNPTIYTTAGSFPQTHTVGNCQTSNGLTGTNSVALNCFNSSSSVISNDSGINSGYALTSTSAAPTWTTSNISIGDQNDGTLTIDLSTHADQDDGELKVTFAEEEDHGEAILAAAFEEEK